MKVEHKMFVVLNEHLVFYVLIVLMCVPLRNYCHPDHTGSSKEQGLLFFGIRYKYSLKGASFLNGIFQGRTAVVVCYI